MQITPNAKNTTTCNRKPFFISAPMPVEAGKPDTQWIATFRRKSIRRSAAARKVLGEQTRAWI
jgi:hypothetical protein